MTAAMKQFSRQVLVAALIILAAAAVIYAIQILLLAFAGILLAIFFRSAGMWLHHHTRLSVAWSMAVVLVGFGTVFLGLLSLFGVQIANQADQLFWAVSQAYSQFHQKLAQYHVAGGISAGGGLNLEAPAKAVASSVLWMLAAAVMVLFLGVYLSITPELYLELFLGFFRGPVRRRAADLLDGIASALRWWIAGQLISMAIVGGITIVGLLTVGAPMAVSLGVLAMILTFVPYVGAIVSAVPAILLAFTKDTHLALWVMLVYLAAHVVEGYIVTPLIQHRLVYLPPALILATQFLTHLFAGSIGLALATPLMVVAMVLIKELYFKQEWTEPSEEAA
jgi:predicted PurR-regulated permease PerM